jgi:hypothetical protein
MRDVSAGTSSVFSFVVSSPLPQSMYTIDPHMLNKKAHMKDLD